MQPNECNQLRERHEAHTHSWLRAAWLVAFLCGMTGANVGATQVATPLEPSLEVGVEQNPAPYVFPFRNRMAATDSSLLVNNVGKGGFALIHLKGDGTWQIKAVPGGGEISAISSGYLLNETGTTYTLNADLSRSRVMNSKVTLLDEATGAPRWAAEWSGRAVDSSPR